MTAAVALAGAEVFGAAQTAVLLAVALGMFTAVLVFARYMAHEHARAFAETIARPRLRLPYASGESAPACVKQALETVIIADAHGCTVSDEVNTWVPVPRVLVFEEMNTTNAQLQAYWEAVQKAGAR